MGRKRKVTVEYVLSAIGQLKSQAQMARELNVSHAAVYKVLCELERRNVIRGISGYPKLYERVFVDETGKLQSSVRYGGEVQGGGEIPTQGDQRRLVELHRCGKYYKVTSGRVDGRRASRRWSVNKNLECFEFNDDLFRIICYSGAKKQSLVIWVKSVRGYTLLQQTGDARHRMSLRIKRFALEQSITALFDKYGGPIEITFPNKMVSDLIDASLNLDPKKGGGPKRVGSGVYTTGTSSHSSVHNAPIDGSWEDTTPYPRTVPETESVRLLLEHAADILKLPAKIEDILTGLTALSEGQTGIARGLEKLASGMPPRNTPGSAPDSSNPSERREVG